MSDGDGLSTDALADIAYLSRSENRLRVLDTLTDAPHSARDLRDATGTSKATLNRILNEFEDRLWARRTTDGTYEATAQGEHLVAQFRPIVGAMDTLRSLGEDLAILPVDELRMGPTDDLTVSLDHFSDATVKRQRPQAHGVGRDQMVEAARTTSELAVLTDMAPPRVLGTVLQDRAEGGDLSGTLVWTAELLEYCRDNPDEPPKWRDVIEAGCRLYWYDDHIPATLFVADEVTLIWGATGEMRRRVLISHNETVRTWALNVVERYREQATAIDPQTVP